MDIRILGPLEVLDNGRALELGGAKQRAVLALLAVNANHAVSTDQLVLALWEDEPPESARKAIQVYVSQLRKTLGKDRLQSKGGGYLLRVGPDELDLDRFEALRDRGDVDAALALWRGEPFAELTDYRFARTEASRLEELRLACIEQRIERELAAGRHAEVVGELESLAGMHPARERLLGQLMLALYRSGRQAEALESYRAARDTLMRELGLEPGRELRDLHQRVLRQDAALDLARREAPKEVPAVTVSTAVMRKTVTVLFCDLAESTQLGERLDPEALRTVMTRWYEAMRAPIERSGGTVEKFVGDAVMAVFGVPAAHEDDAFRAVQAAVEMIDAAAGLGVDVRIGVNTGEVVTGDATTTLVTGDAVNTAKRLEEAAAPAEILIGAATRRLVAHATELEPLGSVAAKGKRDPVEAWRVLATIAGATALPRRLDVPLVGRARDLALLEAELQAATRDRACRLVTVCGPAGVGKSRLAQELLARADAEVLTARCVPYGDGITFLPLRDLLGETPAGSNDEIFWEVRRQLQERAQAHPLLLCIEDVHWAQPAFLDLVEYLHGWSRDAPILVVCLSRPDLYDIRPRWPGTTLTLEPLTRDESAALLDELDVPVDARARIVDAAEGNPLFLEQMVAMLADVATAEMPPTIHALLTSRLDRLEPFEQAVLQRAAVVGKDFSRNAVVALSPEEERADVAAALLSLTRKELVRPDHSGFADEDGFRFRHALIRDAAYAGVPKRVRAELHERFADWLAPRTDVEELVGYHLEQAYRCRVELGAPDDALASRAFALLATAGKQAYARDDVKAAVNLLERAVDLVPADADVLITLGRASMSAGDFTRGRAALEAARVAAAGDKRLETRAAIEIGFNDALRGSATAAIVELAERSIPTLLELGDDAGLSRAWQLVTDANVGGRWAERTEALERALHYAERAGDRRQQSSVVALLAQALHYGPTPVGAAVERCEELLADGEDDRALAAALMSTLGGLTAMRGDFDRARSLWAHARGLYEELGLQHRRAARSLIPATIELLAGDPVAAERELRYGYETLAAMGETWVRATVAAYLAAVLAELGRNDEAIALTRESEANSSDDDVVTQVVWRGARARALGDAGLARDAVERALATDFLDLRAGAYLDLAAVHDPSVAALAVEEYERKGNLVGAARARTLITV